ncbi:ABC transporter permease [Boseongicola sp. H5]|uniref:ABC transporter permease n=1 Tax=Boseongicola sp. H5 TaxID=2763261 RepID=UPI001D0AD71A|nr:ABC transporter permease [Boseongicola sp. H5]
MTLGATDPVAPPPVVTRSLWRRFTANPVALAGLVVFILLALMAVFAPYVAPQDPYDLANLSLLDNLLPPGSTGMNGQSFWLGTDPQGRDMLSAMIYGMRTSIFIGLTSAVIALMIGATVGLVAAFAGGWLDAVLMRLVELVLAFPTILIALVLMSIFGSGIDKLLIAMIMAQWAGFARVTRSAALVEMEREYMTAARAMGFGRMRILVLHLFPNCLPPLMVLGLIQIADAIALEATLSFLGLGVPVTEPSLGLLIASGFDYILTQRYWITIFPGILLLILVMSVNLAGDHLRNLLNPRLQK